MKLKNLVILLAILFLLQKCNVLGPKTDEAVKVSFTVKNTLLWHIGHDYKVTGTEADGNNFTSSELEIRYAGVLLDGKEIKEGSKLKLYRDNKLFWTSKAISKNCSITYTDSAYEDKVVIN